jgi:pimeloyl-ACP methyl ester carboxylesterase
MPIAKIGDVHIHYQIQGLGAPLLLIMGYRGSGFMWGELLISGLSHYFQVITFDNRGTGLSDKPDTMYTIPMMADDTAGLLHHLGIAKAHVFGVSMGGMIAQELALRHPKRVHRLILGCTTCGGPQTILAPVEVLQKMLAPPNMPREEALRQQWQVIFSPGFAEKHAAFLNQLSTLALAHPTPFHTSMRQLMAMQRFNAYGRLGQIVAATLVVTGADDIVIPPANSRLLANRIHNATLESFAGAGHGFFWEATKALIDLLCEFCYPYQKSALDV